MATYDGLTIYSKESAELPISANGNSFNGEQIVVEETTTIPTSMNNVVLNDLEISGKNFTISSGNGLFKNTKVSNAVSENCGAINVTGGKLFLDGAEFSSNTNTNTNGTGGGAIFHRTGGSLNISNSTFFYNIATHGGAVDFNKETTISDSYFEGNTASSNGGALRVYKGVTISGSTFTKNKASAGGAIYTASATTINNCLFDGNISGNGGAIYNNGATITFQGTTFATSGDSIHTNKAGALIFKGNNTLCGNITGGSVTITLSGAVLTIGSGVSFSKVVTAAVDTTNEVVLKGRSISFASGQTFENISVTVDVSDWLTAGDYTIAANVGGINSIDDITVVKAGNGFVSQDVTYDVETQKISLTVTDISIASGKTFVAADGTADGVTFYYQEGDAWYNAVKYDTVANAITAEKTDITVILGGTNALVFDNNSAVSVTLQGEFSSDEAVVLKGSQSVTFAGTQSFAGVSITVDAEDYSENGTYERLD